MTLTKIAYETYCDTYANEFYEWVEGVLVPMTPVSRQQDNIALYLRMLLASYLSYRPIGVVHSAPFVMRLPTSAREPDVQLILHSNTGTLTETMMQGPADLCVEVVSLESVQRDHGEKLAEYEAGGVGEYWIIDPLRRETRFFQRAESDYFVAIADRAGIYETPLLPQLRLDTTILWRSPLPEPPEILAAVQAMLA